MDKGSHYWGSLKIPLSLCCYTVDGRSPAPVDVVDIAVLIGFYTNQVVQDFLSWIY